MSSRDWENELRKIDRQLESISDDALIPADGGRGAPAGAPALPAGRGASPAVVEKRAKTRTLGAFLRLALATALGVGILFWPYGRCGPELYGYLAAVLAVSVAGGWSAVWTWKHRTARAHVLSLLIVLWGLLLGATEILPRVGYAKTADGQPVSWTCTPP